MPIQTDGGPHSPRDVIEGCGIAARSSRRLAEIRQPRRRRREGRRRRARHDLDGDGRGDTGVEIDVVGDRAESDRPGHGWKRVGELEWRHGVGEEGLVVGVEGDAAAGEVGVIDRGLEEELAPRRELHAVFGRCDLDGWRLRIVGETATASADRGLAGGKPHEAVVGVGVRGLLTALSGDEDALRQAFEMRPHLDAERSLPRRPVGTPSRGQPAAVALQPVVDDVRQRLTSSLATGPTRRALRRRHTISGPGPPFTAEDHVQEARPAVLHATEGEVDGAGPALPEIDAEGQCRDVDALRGGDGDPGLQHPVLAAKAPLELDAKIMG